MRNYGKRVSKTHVMAPKSGLSIVKSNRYLFRKVFTSVQPFKTISWVKISHWIKQDKQCDGDDHPDNATLTSLKDINGRRS